MRVEKWGDTTVQDRKLSELVSSECSIPENTYKILLSTSSTRSMARLSSTMSRTAAAAAMPSSSRPINRANTTLGSSSNFSNVEFNVFFQILVLDEEQRRVLENGGGTSETTNALRMVIGKNFEEYCVYHEEEWCKKPLEAPDWWTNAAGKPRKVEELLLDECLPVFSGYLKNWLWTMQVLS